MKYLRKKSVKRRHFLKGGSYRSSAQTSRYSSYFGKGRSASVRLNVSSRSNQKVKKRSQSSKSKSNRLHSNFVSKKYEKNLRHFKEQLDKIEKQNYTELNITKDNLIGAWKIGMHKWKQGNKTKGASYILMSLLISTILLNKKAAYKSAFQTSFALNNQNAHLLMCGISNTAKRSALEHKTKVKEIVVKLGGIEQFIGYLNSFLDTAKQFDLSKIELDPMTIDKLHDFIYTCNNPYVKQIVKNFPIPI